MLLSFKFHHLIQHRKRNSHPQEFPHSHQPLTSPFTYLTFDLNYHLSCYYLSVIFFSSLFIQCVSWCLNIQNEKKNSELDNDHDELWNFNGYDFNLIKTLNSWWYWIACTKKNLSYQTYKHRITMKTEITKLLIIVIYCFLCNYPVSLNHWHVNISKPLIVSPIVLSYLMLSFYVIAHLHILYPYIYICNINRRQCYHIYVCACFSSDLMMNMNWTSKPQSP